MFAILIVGDNPRDNPSTAELLWLHAQQGGHQPVIAFTEKKKELIDDRLPEVVILDWTLPDMTGLSLLSALRSLRSFHVTRF
jgi:two-component system phosphate regulon response regulator PhoB